MNATSPPSIPELGSANSDILVPDGTPIEAALERTTHLGVGAHQDDLEIMAYHGISACHGEKKLWFAGVTCTDGAGSSRVGPYKDYSNEEMIEARKEEQRQAAQVGMYGSMIQLCRPSDEISDRDGRGLPEDLYKVFSLSKPEIIYAHNPADKHLTHIAVLHATIDALRRMDPGDRPKHVYGCEVWRDLDWMPDEKKIALDVSYRENLAAALIGVFDSQITGGKRYDLASAGRRYANATFSYARGNDEQRQVTFALDLTPLVHDDSLDVVDYVLEFVDEFRADVKGKLSKWFR
jgi:LmbE family N-acetylglucosaminyl deacetylase